ncbi:recombinase family protein [Bradyrhizobium sp. DN5]|uniref:recombinase family protein n=1 Tax=Bradyrhizobium sp. DN5 TaxID=3056950 RepID=UPI003525FBF6
MTRKSRPPSRSRIRSRCAAHSASMRVTSSLSYSDHGISGPSTINRMGFQRLMPNARSRKFDVIDSKSLDRISRDLKDLGGFHNEPGLPASS